MKLVKSKCDLLTQSKDYPGLLKASYRYRVSSTEGDIVYNGPVIPPHEWHKMLSFFRWTYETTKSESQARLYVNTIQGTWAAWAYPQEARTGMSAKELDTPDAKTQRAQFPDSEGWVYFGTVHHHCNTGAFQSWTDLSNEQTQDGLHITIGDIGKDRHTMHCRFYLGGDEFAPDMSMFWNISDELRALLPVDLHDRVARHQMGDKVEIAFPQQWKENLIEVKGVGGWIPGDQVSGFTGAGSGSGAGTVTSVRTSPEYRPLWMRTRDAIVTIKHEMTAFGVDVEDMIDALNFMKTDKASEIILDAIRDENLTLVELFIEIEFDDPPTTANDHLLAEGGQKLGGTEEKDKKDAAQEQQRQSTDHDGWAGYVA